jgi:hypothetical protein
MIENHHDPGAGRGAKLILKAIRGLTITIGLK